MTIGPAADVPRDPFDPEILGFDPAELRRKYAHERAIRLRPDGNEQFVEVTNAYARFEDDPLAETVVPRAPIEIETDAVILGGDIALEGMGIDPKRGKAGERFRRPRRQRALPADQGDPASALVHQKLCRRQAEPGSTACNDIGPAGIHHQAGLMRQPRCGPTRCRFRQKHDLADMPGCLHQAKRIDHRGEPE